jgi:hypothetical protein
MALLNPNAPLRNAYLTAWAATGLPVWAKKVPKSAVIPKQYILITSQTKQRTEVSKDCFEWLCQIVVDIIYVGAAGYASPIKNDDIEEIGVNAIQAGIVVAGFDVKSYDFIQSLDLDIETDTQSIERRVITYEHWLQQID